MKLTNTLAVTALVAGSLFAGSTALPAQDATTNTPTAPQAAPQHARPEIATILSLTDDQKPKFKAIMSADWGKQKALRDDKSLSVADRQAKLKAIKDDTATQMKALLTPEQFAKWEKMTQHQRPMPAAHAIPATNAAAQK
jgi:Spy/CpxP family protein refolding chaperone